jgi:hypothetical protein
MWRVVLCAETHRNFGSSDAHPVWIGCPVVLEDVLSPLTLVSFALTGRASLRRRENRSAGHTVSRSHREAVCRSHLLTHQVYDVSVDRHLASQAIASTNEGRAKLSVQLLQR